MPLTWDQKVQREALAIVEGGRRYFDPSAYAYVLERIGLDFARGTITDVDMAWEYLDFLTR